MWVDVFTVNNPARMEQLIAMGVDLIETDRPDLMADIIFAGDADNDFDVDGADFLSWQRQGNFATNLAAWQKTFGHQQGSLPAAAVPLSSPSPNQHPSPSSSSPPSPLAPGSSNRGHSVNGFSNRGPRSHNALPPRSPWRYSNAIARPPRALDYTP